MQWNKRKYGAQKYQISPFFYHYHKSRGKYRLMSSPSGHWGRKHAKAWWCDKQLVLLLDEHNVRRFGWSIPRFWHLQRKFSPIGRLEASGDGLAHVAGSHDLIEVAQCPDLAIERGAGQSSGISAGEVEPSASCGDAMREGASEAEAGRVLWMWIANLWMI